MVFSAVLAMVNLTLNEPDCQLTISHIGAGVAAALGHAGMGMAIAPVSTEVWARSGAWPPRAQTERARKLDPLEDDHAA